MLNFGLFDNIFYLRIVNNTIRQLVAYFLLLCISATVVPFNLLHYHEEHEEDIHCDVSNIVAENDPCHISIYHGQNQEDKCEHTTHLSDVQDDCERCKFLTTQRHQYIANEHCAVIPIVLSQDFLITEASFLVRSSSNSTLGRAPPTC